MLCFCHGWAGPGAGTKERLPRSLCKRKGAAECGIFLWRHWGFRVQNKDTKTVGTNIIPFASWWKVGENRLEQNDVFNTLWDTNIKEKLHHCIRACEQYNGSTSVEINMEKTQDPGRHCWSLPRFQRHSCLINQQIELSGQFSRGCQGRNKTGLLKTLQKMFFFSFFHCCKRASTTGTV